MYSSQCDFKMKILYIEYVEKNFWKYLKSFKTFFSLILSAHFYLNDLPKAILFVGKFLVGW